MTFRECAPEWSRRKERMEPTSSADSRRGCRRTSLSPWAAGVLPACRRRGCCRVRRHGFRRDGFLLLRRRARPRRPRGPLLAVKEMRPRARSTSRTRTLSLSPTFTTSAGSLTNLSASWEMCTSPSRCTPTSTNAPKLVTLVTTPSSSMPSVRSSMVFTSSRNAGGSNSSRGVAPGLLELVHDVAQGRLAHALAHVPGHLYLVGQLLVAHQLGDSDPHVRGDALHQLVALRVHRGRVQRVLGPLDTEEPGGLLERLGSQALHLQKLLARAEPALLGAILHHALGGLRPDAGHPREQGCAGGVELHAPRRSRSSPPPPRACARAGAGARRAGTGPPRWPWARS